MAKRKAGDATASTTTTPQIFKATLGVGGEVVKDDRISETQAIAERRFGRDVVVCGDDLSANRGQAQAIEHTANGGYKRCPPHVNAGPNALPHFQPKSRPPDGHTFYETPNRKAK